MIPFPISETSKIEHGGPLPPDTDAVIIGAGVVGISAALFLRQLGHRVVVLEKGRVACEQSSRNWGWIRQQGRDPHELPLMIEARRHWLDFSRRTNESLGLVEGGVTYLAESDKDMTAFSDWLVYAKEHELDSHMMSGREVAEMIPEMARRYPGALRTPSDMRAEPWVAVPTLARLAAEDGAVIVENCAARMLDIEAGRVTGVVTEQGRIRAGQVLVCGGAWSSLFLQNHGVRIPQLSVRATAAATNRLPEIHAGGVADNGVAFRRRQDGGYTIAAGAFHDLYVGPDAFRNLPKYLHTLAEHPFGTRYHAMAPQNYPDAWGTPRTWAAEEQSPFERMRVLNPAPSNAAKRKFLKQFRAMFPGFGEIGLRAVWAGMIDLMPDVVPVIDRCETIPGLWIGTGLSGHGFGIGPEIGRVLAYMMMGQPPKQDLTRFRLSRFTDGTKVRPGPAL